MRAHGARRGVLSVTGLQSALARIGAIRQLVSDTHAPVVASGTSGATSFADALGQATLLDAAAGSVPAAVVAAPGLTGSRTLTALPGSARLAVATTIVPPAASRSRVATVTAPAEATARAASASYRPAHVTETDEKVWNDCTWASAAMWIDKLTGGSVKVDREKLRAASGDLTGGSSLGDVVRGARKLLGMDLEAAHAERLTVNGLLDRLAAGGGAIVQGSYSSLPAHLARHDLGFAAKGAAASGHAVYVGPLDRATGRVWWDDPLAPAGGSGEWISVKDLKAFMWTDSHGRVSAMATPEGFTGSGAASATGSAGSAASTGSAATGSSTPGAAAISAAAWTAGVDPLLLAAYLDVADEPADSAAIAEGATDLAAALAQHGRADQALASLGVVQGGPAGRAGGAPFANDVLRAWADLLDTRPGG